MTWAAGRSPCQGPTATTTWRIRVLGVATLLNMRMGEAELLRIRLSPRYRTAVWLDRFGLMIGVPTLVLAFRADPPVGVFLVSWLLLMATTTPGAWLCFAAVPTGRRQWTWTDPGYGRAFVTDIFLPKPRLSSSP